MNHIDFDRLVEQETQRMKDVMCSKSADYSAAYDKLFNFKLAAELDGISPIEALRGMWLKHRTSIRQGLDELLEGKPCRSEAWWIEKFTDDRNYSILLQALLVEEYFTFVCPEGWVIKFLNRNGWWVGRQYRNHETDYLQKSSQLHCSTGGGYHQGYKFGEAPGYWPTKEAAEAALQQYLEKQDRTKPVAGGY